MGSRRDSRQFALQMLFQIDLGGGAAHEIAEQFWSGTAASDEVRERADVLVRGVLRDREDLDRRIVEAAANWRLERIAAVERNILRLAVFELTREPATPAAVVIDEAIELGKRFGGGESGSFLNGVLDAVRRRIA